MLMDQDWRYRMSETDHEVFEMFLPMKHRLLDMLEQIPWEQFSPILEEYYHPTRGQPAIKPLILLKLELLRYIYSLSDRQVIDRSGTDLLFRYFLQIPGSFRLPDPSVLVRFRGRLGVDGFKSVFDRLVACAREAGLVQDRLRLKDASHIIANIAIPTAQKLLGQIRDRLLDRLAKFDSELCTGFRLAVDQVREQTRGADTASCLESRVKLVRDVLDGIAQLPLPTDCESDSDWQELQKLSQLAEKILSDQAHPERGRRTLSVVDSDARRGKHGDWYDGYVLDVLMDADSGIITQMNMMEAGGDEAKSAIAMIEAEREAHGNHVEQLSIDGAGFNGAMLQKLEDPEGLNVKVFVPPKAPPASELFPNTAFELSGDGTSVTCPNGETSSYSQIDTGKNGKIFRFKRSQCDHCPLQKKCVAKPKEGAFGRSVAKNNFQAEYDRARERSKTQEYQSIRCEHPAIERKINEIMNHCGGRFARYWGHQKVQIQQYMSCMAANAKRITQLMGRTCAVNA